MEPSLVSLALIEGFVWNALSLLILNEHFVCFFVLFYFEGPRVIRERKNTDQRSFE